eukprot:6863909-Pyramimonas_sp.AAC.1
MDIQHLTHTCVLCLQSCLMKWYMTWRIEEHRHYVCMYGFRSGRKTSRNHQRCQEAPPALPCLGQSRQFVACLDMLQAFDNVIPCLAMRCLRALDIPSDLIVALIEHMMDNRCLVSFESIEASSAVYWTNLFELSIVLWRDVIERWRQKTQYDIKLENDKRMFNSERMTHSFWTDNLLFYAKTRTDLELMVRDIKYPADEYRNDLVAGTCK